MINFNLRLIFKNKILWAWPGIFLLFVAAMLYWGDISSAKNSYSFMLLMGDAEIPARMVMSQLITFVILFSIIGFPNHFAKSLEPERGSLLLSKPISRTQVFFSDFVSVLTVAASYALISTVLIAVLLAIKGGIFPFQLFLGLLLFLPLLVMTYYTTIVLFLILTDSYLAGALLGWILTGFSSAFLRSEQILETFGFTSSFTQHAVDAFSYLIPSSGAINKILTQLYSGGFGAIDGGLLAFAIASCLPLGALSYYLYLKKEF
jgi:ABC-type transport system involved in multi-copper enzyme maturation permease subunit